MRKDCKYLLLGGETGGGASRKHGITCLYQGALRWRGTGEMEPMKMTDCLPILAFRGPEVMG